MALQAWWALGFHSLALGSVSNPFCWWLELSRAPWIWHQHSNNTPWGGPDKTHSLNEASTPVRAIIQRRHDQRGGPGGWDLYGQLCYQRQAQAWEVTDWVEVQGQGNKYSLPGLSHWFNACTWSDLKRIFCCPTGQPQAGHRASWEGQISAININSI